MATRSDGEVRTEIAAAASQSSVPRALDRGRFGLASRDKRR
jgi:hypothetical protein